MNSSRAKLRAIKAGAAIAVKPWLSLPECLIYLGTSKTTFMRIWFKLLSKFRPAAPDGSFSRPLFERAEIDRVIRLSNPLAAHKTKPQARTPRASVKEGERITRPRSTSIVNDGRADVKEA